jgi:polyisoprenoid-binding protein YceI
VTTQISTQQQTVWAFDPAHTLVEFSVKHMMVATVKGRFTDVNGTITGSLDDPTNAQIDVRIGAASIDSRNEQRDAHLKSPDFLDVENYPEITFKSTKIEEVSQDHYRVSGDLTIRGVTRPVELDAAVNGVGKSPWGQEVLGVSVETIITRADFGLNWNVALETGGVLVGNTAKISIELEAVKQEAGQPA